MVLEKLFGKGKSEEQEEDFLEVSPVVEEGKVSVRIESLRDLTDTERVQQMVREGNVVFLRIRPLREKDITELKRAVDKLKKTIVAMNGDIVGVDEDFLIITPKFAKIFRGK